MNYNYKSSHTYIPLNHLGNLDHAQYVAERKRDTELAGLVGLGAQVVAIVTQVLRLDLIAELVVYLALEREDVISELQVHDLRLRLRFEDAAQVFQVLHLPVEQELAVGEFIILIASHVLLDLERDTTGLRHMLLLTWLPL